MKDNQTFTYNSLILETLVNYLNNNPQVSFGQALVNLNIIKYKFGNNQMTIRDPFYEESEITYNELKK
jgi:hypothetical protein